MFQRSPELSRQHGAAVSDRRGRRWAIRAALLIALFSSLTAFITAAWFWWTSPVPHEAVSVASGITYACIKCAEDEAQGLAHIVCVDLRTPGLQLFVTPLSPEVLADGWEYKTCWPPSVAIQENLTVAVNGTLFSTGAARWKIWPGQLTRSLETIVSNHQVNHLDQNSYLLWFDENLVPTMEVKKPPSLEACQRAKWGISGQGVALHQGVVSQSANHRCDTRTIIGFDAKSGRLFLGVYDSASEYRAAQILAEQGATEAILLDGGSSSCLTFAQAPPGTARRTPVHPSRAVATVFGVRVAQ